MLDRVVSSYVYTVKSLAYARERATNAERSELRTNAMLLGMPTTPAAGDLQFVKDKIESIDVVLKTVSISTLVEMNPVKARVLSTLAEHGIVHFACHGSSEVDPAESKLLLEDWETTPLTVLDLMSLHIKLARFAYLSACHTSAMKDFCLLDEFINLVSVIQLYGYPAVVGSLWQVEDQRAAKLTKNVYEWILAGDSGFDPRHSGAALHNELHRLREET